MHRQHSRLAGLHKRCKVAGLYIFWAVLSQQICFSAPSSVCGVRSYRRGRPNSGDIDFTILAPLSYKGTCKPLLNRILFRLREIVRRDFVQTRGCLCLLVMLQ